MLISIVDALIYILPTVYKVSLSPTSSPAFVLYFLVDGHSDWGEMES
jgi:hypothetical protein